MPDTALHRFRAAYLDGWSLAETPVSVQPHEGGLRIYDASGALLADWPRNELHADAMQEGGVLHVTRGAAGPETLVVHDPELEQRVLALSAKVSALPGGARKLRFALTMLAAVAAVGAALYYATPIAARFVAKRIPLEQERALGAQVETLLDFSRCSDDAAQAALETLAMALAHDDGGAYEVRLMQSKMANAFALPGGIVIMTTGLLHGAQSESEIAGVLAHEIEHVVQRHVLAGFLRDAALSAVWALTMGDYAGLLIVDPTTAYRVANLEFSRADEQAADRGAIARLHRAGLSHKGLADFFARAQKEHGEDGPEWLSTHPSTEGRIARIRQTPDLSTPQAVLSDAQLASLKRACESVAPSSDDVH